MSPPKPLKILCFGDSLTAGYHRFGLRFTPYSTTLLTTLNQKLKHNSPNYDIEITTDGVSGELVTGSGFEARMKRRYPSPNPQTEPPHSYDWVIFLGGTNDLGWGKTAAEIWDSIISLTNIPLSHGAKIVMMTIPECAVKSERLDSRREGVNALIRADGREGVHVFDLHRHVPYHSMDGEERGEIWDDGLHFSGKGYERIGEMVGERLGGIIEGESESAGKMGG